MAPKNRLGNDIEFEVIMVEEMTEENINSVVQFIADIVYKNIKRTLTERKENYSTTDLEIKE
jgi:hypothetical protein